MGGRFDGELHTHLFWISFYEMPCLQLCTNAGIMQCNNGVITSPNEWSSPSSNKAFNLAGFSFLFWFWLKKITWEKLSLFFKAWCLRGEQSRQSFILPCPSLYSVAAPCFCSLMTLLYWSFPLRPLNCCNYGRVDCCEICLLGALSGTDNSTGVFWVAWSLTGGW